MSKFALLKQKDGEVSDNKKDDPNWRRLSRFLIGALKGKQKRRQTSGDMMESDDESVEASSSNEDEYSRKKRQEAEMRLRMLDEADTLSECSSVTNSFCNQTPDLMRSPRDKESEDGNVISNLSSRVDRCSESNSVTYSNSFVESLEEDVGYQYQTIIDDEEGQTNDIVVVNEDHLTLQPLDNAVGGEEMALVETNVGVLAKKDCSQEPCGLADVREGNQVENLCLNSPTTPASVLSGDNNRCDEDDVNNRDDKRRGVSVVENNSGEVGGTGNVSGDDKKLEIETMDANEVDTNEVVTAENIDSFFTTIIEEKEEKEEEEKCERIPIVPDDCDIPSNEDYPVVEKPYDDMMLNILLVHESNNPTVDDSFQADLKCSPHVENDRSVVKEVLFEERNRFREPINVDIFKPYNETCREKLFESILYFDSVNLLQNVSCNKGSSSNESVADGKQQRAKNSTKRRQSLLGQTVNRPLQNCIDKGRLVARIKEKMDRARTFIEKLTTEAAYKKAVRNFAEAVDDLLVDSPLQEKKIDEKVYSADDISLRQKLNPTRLDILRTPVPRRRKPLLLNFGGEPSNLSRCRSKDETLENIPHALDKRSQTFTFIQNSYDEDDDTMNDKTWSVPMSDPALKTHPTAPGIDRGASIDCKEYQTPLELELRKDERISSKLTPENVHINTRERDVHTSGSPVGMISPLVKVKVCEKTADDNDDLSGIHDKTWSIPKSDPALKNHPKVKPCEKTADDNDDLSGVHDKTWSIPKSGPALKNHPKVKACEKTAEDNDDLSAIHDKTWSVPRSDVALQTHHTVAGISTDASIDCKQYQKPLELEPRKDERTSSKHTPENVHINTRERGVHNSGTPAGMVSPLVEVCEKTAEDNYNDVVNNSSEATDKQDEKTYEIGIHRDEDDDLLNDEDIAFSSSEDETLDFVASMIGNADDYMYLEEEDFFDSGIQTDKQTNENYTQKKGRNSTIDCAGSNIPVPADTAPIDFPLKQDVSLTNIASTSSGDITKNLEVDDKVSKLSVKNLGEENQHKILGMSPSNFPINMSSKWCNIVDALDGNEEENITSTPAGMSMAPSLIDSTHNDVKLSGYGLKMESSKQNQSSHPDVASQEHQQASLLRSEMSRNEASDTTVLNESESFMSSTSGEYSLLPGPDKLQTTWSELLSHPYGKYESWSPSTFRRQENQNVDNPNSQFPLSELLVREKPATDVETIDLVDKPEIFQRVGDESLPFVTRPALCEANQPTLRRLEDPKIEAMSDNHVLNLLVTTSECLRQLRTKMAFFEDLEKALTNSDDTSSLSQIPGILCQNDDLLATSSRNYDDSYEYLSKSEAELKRSLNATIGDISKSETKDEVVSKRDNTIEVISRGGNTDAIIAKGDNTIEVISRGDNTDAIISKGDNTDDAISRGTNTDLGVSRGDNTVGVGVMSRGNNTVGGVGVMSRGDNTVGVGVMSRGDNTVGGVGVMSRGDNTVGVGVMSRGDNTVRGVGVMSRGNNTVGGVGVMSRDDNTVAKVVFESAVQVGCLSPVQTDQATLTNLEPETREAGCDCPLEDAVISSMSDVIQGGTSDTRRSKSSVEERVSNMELLVNSHLQSKDSNLNVTQETLAELRKDIVDNSESLKMFTTCIMNGLKEEVKDCIQGLTSGLQEQISSVQTGLSKLQESKPDPCPCPHDKTVTKEDVDRLRLRLVDMKSQRDVEKMYHKITRESLRALDRDHDRLRQEMLLTSSRRRHDDRRMSPHHQVLVNETAKSSFRDDNRSLFTSTPKKQKDSKDKETPQTSTSTSSKEKPALDSPE